MIPEETLSSQPRRWRRAAARMAASALVLFAAGCARRSAVDEAAERAQDACIGALEPVSQAKVPSAGVLEEALVDAGEAAGVDGRWAPLLAQLQLAKAARGTPLFVHAIDELAAECGRVNEIVRRGGREPSSA